MEIEIDIGYYSINQLLTEITFQMSEATTSITRDRSDGTLLSRAFGGEGTPFF
jgi:hypothetical protein